MEMSEALWSHIKEWVEMYKKHYGKLPGTHQLTAYFYALEPMDTSSEAIKDDDDEPDEE